MNDQELVTCPDRWIRSVEQLHPPNSELKAVIYNLCCCRRLVQTLLLLREKEKNVTLELKRRPSPRRNGNRADLHPDSEFDKELHTLLSRFARFTFNLVSYLIKLGLEEQQHKHSQRQFRGTCWRSRGASRGTTSV